MSSEQNDFFGGGGGRQARRAAPPAAARSLREPSEAGPLPGEKRVRGCSHRASTQARGFSLDAGARALGSPERVTSLGAGSCSPSLSPGPQICPPWEEGVRLGSVKPFGAEGSQAVEQSGCSGGGGVSLGNRGAQQRKRLALSDTWGRPPWQREGTRSSVQAPKVSDLALL